MIEWLSAAVSIATMVGVLIAASQLWLRADQAASAFEDGFAKEYRALVSTIPTKVFFGEDLSEDELAENLDEFYHYFDLCNEQAFLFEQRRVRRRTWRFWREGMQENLTLPAFARAWRYIDTRIAESSLGSFKHQLRRDLETLRAKAV